VLCCCLNAVAVAVLLLCAPASYMVYWLHELLKVGDLRPNGVAVVQACCRSLGQDSSKPCCPEGCFIGLYRD
jgi:hypothetical protein